MRSLLLILVLLPALAQAQETIFFKCTDASGNVSMQNDKPCAAGMKQEIRRVGAVKTAPLPTATKKAQEPQVEPPQYGEFIQVGGPKPQRTPAPEAVTLPLPPALFQCRTWQNETYYGETESPAPRCMPLQVVGIGNDAPGQASACEIRRDACTAVPEAQLCATWYLRLDDAEFKLRYADDKSKPARQRDLDAIQQKIESSRCATAVKKDSALDGEISGKLP